MSAIHFVHRFNFVYKKKERYLYIMEKDGKLRILRSGVVTPRSNLERLSFQ